MSVISHIELSAATLKNQFQTLFYVLGKGTGLTLKYDSLLSVNANLSRSLSPTRYRCQIAEMGWTVSCTSAGIVHQVQVSDCRNGMDSLRYLSWNCSPKFLICIQPQFHIYPYNKPQVSEEGAYERITQSASFSFLMLWRVDRFIYALCMLVSLLYTVQFCLSPKPDCTSNT